MPQQVYFGGIKCIKWVVKMAKIYYESPLAGHFQLRSSRSPIAPVVLGGEMVGHVAECHMLAKIWRGYLEWSLSLYWTLAPLALCTSVSQGCLFSYNSKWSHSRSHTCPDIFNVNYVIWLWVILFIAGAHGALKLNRFSRLRCEIFLSLL